MVGIIRIGLQVIRAVAELGFFLEAQRLLIRFVRPSSVNLLTRVEDSIISLPSTPVQRRWVDAHGHKLHTLIAGCESNPKIVMLHGHSMSAAFYFRNFDDLVSLGYCVYAVDLLGWGRSDRPSFSGKTPDDTLKWYLDSFSGWIQSMKLKEFTLMGHSLGAYLALEYAKRMPTSVRRLILISPAACAREIPVRRAVYFALPPQSIVRRGGLLGFLLFMVKYPRSLMYVRDRLREYTYHLAVQGPPSGEVAVIPIIRLHGPRRASCTRPLIEHMVHLPMPIQIVCGETDSSMRLEDVHDLYREMKQLGVNVRINVVHGTDHCPHLENPHEFVRVISDFCNLSKGDMRNLK